jgi:Protein kinase domain
MLGKLAEGTVIAGYEILRPLGHGGMGDVYLARKVGGEQRSVALKLLSGGLENDSRFRERFERESHMATSLEHPHIVPVYSTGDVGGVRYIAMRYVDGPTLRDLIDDESPIDPRRALSLFAQIASALDDAHAIGLVHRDIKPGNILISRSGASEFREHAYLTDFGVSKYTGSESGFTKTGQFVGTSLYAAPEQIQGEKITGRTDVYAFGCVLHECLTARLPFEKETEAALLWAQMFEKPAPPSSIRPDLPAELDEVVAMAMAKSPIERFGTCGEVVQAAREALAAAAARGHGAVAAAAGATAVKPVEPVPVESVPVGATAVKPIEDVVENVPVGATVVTPAAEPVVETDGGQAPPEVAPEEEDGKEVAEAVPAGATVITPVADDVPAEKDEDQPPAGATVITPIVAATAAPEVTTVGEPEHAPEPEPEPAVAPAVAAATVITASGPTVTEAPSPPVFQDSRTAIPVPSLPTRDAPAPPPSPGANRRLIAIIGGAVLLLGLGAIAAVTLLGGGGDGGGGTTTNPPTTPNAAAPASVTPPKITGTPRAGNTLTAGRGTWKNAPASYEYQWRRCSQSGGGCASISGATSVKYVIKPADVGRRMSVWVTATNDGGTKTSRSRASSVVLPAFAPPSNVSLPTVSGTPQEGQTLRAGKGTWKGTGPITPTYTWKRCNAGGGSCATISGARGATYTLGSADVGNTIRVEVRASNRAGRKVAASKATAVVQERPSTGGGDGGDGGGGGGGGGDDPPPPPPSEPPPPPPS